MPTTPSGFWYPGPNDTINSISGLFAQQASSAEQALDNRLLTDGVARFTNAEERAIAYENILPAEGTLTYLQSLGRYEKWSGTQWVEIIDEFPPVTGKNGTVSPAVMLTPGQTHYSNEVVNFTQRAGVSILVFGMFVATQASGSPGKGLVRSTVQYQINGAGAWTAAVGAAANGYVPDVYSFDISFSGTFIIPPPTVARTVGLRAYMTLSIGPSARFDYASLTAMSFGQTNNL